MSIEPVDIHLRDTTIGAAPIVGATVSIYDATGTTPVTSAVSNGSGVASFLLETGVYSVRFFKNAVKFSNPLLVEVLAAPEINGFDVTGEIYVPPVSVDPRVCVAHGHFRTGSGGPAKFLDMHFIPKFDPLLIDGAAVLTERVSVRTDKTGYVEIPLYRYGQYDVLVEGREDLNVMISVPNQSNVNLPDLLFPVVAAVSLDPTGPVALATGTEVSLTPVVMASDGRELYGTALGDVRWDTDNHNVAVVVVGPTSLTIRGVGAGTCNLTATRVDTSIIRIPDTPISGVPVVITVT